MLVPPGIWAPVLTGWAIVAVFMAALWALHLMIRNAGIIDVGWSASLPMLALFYAGRLSGGGRSWLLALIVAIWGFRLAVYLLVTRVIGQPEEGRYLEIRRGYGAHDTARFLLFFQAQALIAVILSLPFLLVARHGGEPGALEWFAVALWLGSISAESLADRQLVTFKRNPANRGRVCDVGLWRYSRHPNYFFEALIWVSYALYAMGSPDGWVGLISPAMMAYFLLCVTGVPLAEAQALRSRGEAYRRYQEVTSVFVPWFPRHR